MLNNLAGSVRTAILLALVTAACLAIALVGGSTSAQASGGTYRFADLNASPDVTCPSGQCFTDVDPSNGFYANVNNLYIDGIIGGYVCGGAGEPCDGQNRPYYRPGNNVTRQQMAKFADLGRRNIAEATGIDLNLTGSTSIGLVVSTTVNDAIDGNTSSGAEAIQARCTRANANCYAFYGSTETGDYAGVLSGGKGLYVSNSDATYSALDANASGATSYSVNGHSNVYRSVFAQNGTTSYYAIYVEAPAGSTVGGYFRGDVSITGNLAVSGSCCLSGNIIQNVDGSSLQQGDVVTIVGSSPAVLGDHPVITVKKASSAYDTGVVGIIDAPVYVPDAQTRATYEAEQQAQREASELRRQGMATAEATGTKFDTSSIDMAESTVTDEQGTVHADVASRAMTANTYASIVTSGSFQSVKVDASYGAIKAGDLLVSSPNAGYAMKATDMSKANGAVIGKALGNLDSGTGTVPVMVILK